MKNLSFILVFTGIVFAPLMLSAQANIQLLPKPQSKANSAPVINSGLPISDSDHCNNILIKGTTYATRRICQRDADCRITHPTKGYTITCACNPKALPGNTHHFCQGRKAD